MTANGVYDSFRSLITSSTWRKRYLTNETSDVLFRRAKWFRLEKKEGQWEKKFTMPSLESDGIAGKTKEVDVRLSPPVLILFESPPDLEKAVDKKNPCLLRTGFLVLELYFPEDAFLKSNGCTEFEKSGPRKGRINGGRSRGPFLLNSI